MLITQEDLKEIRNYTFETHCPQIKISQKQGIELLGYGILKINPHGVFYLDFICFEKKQIANTSWSITYPIDHLDQSQKLYLTAKSIDGVIFESEDFSIDLHALDLHKISQHHVFLEKLHVTRRHTNKKNGFYIESNQQFNIPKNKINQTSCTLGKSSSSWNEALIEISKENLSVRIVNADKNYSFIEIIGNVDKDKILDCLTLYIGFCSGTYLQPYYSVFTTNKLVITTLYSRNKNYLHQHFIPAIPSDNVKSHPIQDEYHFNVLRNCINLYTENTESFTSLYAQWKRVWLSFHSVQDIKNLTLVTAIEGLLNDVFIPIFHKSKVDSILEQDIKNIKKLIKSLEIDCIYKERLQNSISYLKDISATKALNFLSDDAILKNEEVKAWKKLRNEVAHPKTKALDISNIYIEQKNFLHCINLFHSLMFQVLSYSGPRYYYSADKEGTKILLFNSAVIN